MSPTQEIMDGWRDGETSGRPVGRLANKVAVVTGSSSGIGRAIAFSFHQEGAHVVCADIREASEHESESGAASSSTADSIDALFVKTDVSNEHDMQNLVQRTVETYGHIDIFVNNAGTSIEFEDPRPIWDADIDVFDRTMRVNARGVFLGCKFASAQIKTQEPHPNGDRGWIINIGSVLGLTGVENAPSMCASKGAVSIMTKSVSLDCAPYRIHVNAICPGFTSTRSIERARLDEQTRDHMIGMHPFRGIGIADDIARVAVFLASEDAGWMTGVSLPVDGGYTAR